MVTITKEPKARLEPIILSPEYQIEVQKYVAQYLIIWLFMIMMALLK